MKGISHKENVSGLAIEARCECVAQRVTHDLGSYSSQPTPVPKPPPCVPGRDSLTGAGAEKRAAGSTADHLLQLPSEPFGEESTMSPIPLCPAEGELPVFEVNVHDVQLKRGTESNSGGQHDRE